MPAAPADKGPGKSASTSDPEQPAREELGHKSRASLEATLGAGLASAYMSPGQVKIRAASFILIRNLLCMLEIEGRLINFFFFFNDWPRKEGELSNVFSRTAFLMLKRSKVVSL